jgi:hypothetical protein
MKKRLVLTSVVLAAVAGGAWLWLTPGLPVKVGMTEKPGTLSNFSMGAS